MSQTHIPAALRRLVHERAGGRCELTALFNPRRDVWIEHFEVREEKLAPKSAVGRVTVRLLQLNHARRLAERRLLVAAGLLPIAR